MDLTLPSPAYLLGGLLFGVYGYVAFRRGRKVQSNPLTCAGIALMLFPYAVSATWMLWAVGVALCGLVYAKWE